MPIDQLPDKLIVPTRDAFVDRYKASVGLRAPAVSTDNGTEPDIDANVAFDVISPVFVEASRQADAATLDGQDTPQLNQTCDDFGLDEQLPAIGASGFVEVTTSVGGANITLGQEIKNKLTGFKYTCAQAGVYNSTGATPNDLVPVIGEDTGPATNVDPGTVLEWTSPPPGLSPQAVVFENADGTGLTGGSDAETADEQRARIRASRAFPAVSGNDAAYQKAAAQTPGVAVAQAFTYPAILGPGTTCLLFVLRPSTPGAGRIPNAAQTQLVRANVIPQMAKDDSSSFGFITAQPVDIRLVARWAQGIASWTDGIPWPPQSGATFGYEVQASPAPTAIEFTIATADPGAVAPQTGQTIGFFMLGNVIADPNNIFVRKRILSVSGSNPWTITIDGSNAVSDVTNVPPVGSVAMPWSDSLETLASAIVNYFATIGPGEMKADGDFFDAGFRQRRNPPPPKFWPKSFTNKALGPLEALDSLEDIEIVSPTTPLEPTIGTPGVMAFMLTLNSIAAYPL